MINLSRTWEELEEHQPIKHELARDEQAYFLYHRVQGLTIPSISIFQSSVRHIPIITEYGPIVELRDKTLHLTNLLRLNIYHHNFNRVKPIETYSRVPLN